MNLNIYILKYLKSIKKISNGYYQLLLVNDNIITLKRLPHIVNGVFYEFIANDNKNIDESLNLSKELLTIVNNC